MIFDIYLKSDMLSVRKVKIHGMSEPKWTTKDKMTQYKGLINLYKRDKKIVLADKSISFRRDKDIVLRLKRDLAASRAELDNAIFGDRQNIRNALSEDRRLQLAYQDLEPEKIIEHIHQDNFNYRKQLDLLRCKTMEKAEILVSIKLLSAELEDRLVYAAPGKLPIEIECAKLTARVQDAILKKEAAIVINEAYKKIVNVCKKDAIYFDTILESLRTDRVKQGQCVLNAIVLGQLAMEYLDDTRKEFRRLERIVKLDMNERQKVLDQIWEQVHIYTKNIKFRIRKDSDITLPVLKCCNANVDIKEQFNFVCKLLSALKSSFSANSYYELTSCLEEQFRQKERLEELKEKWLVGRDTLQNKIDHATMMYDTLHNTMIETTLEYKRAKQSLKDQILKKNERIKECRLLREKSAGLLAVIKTSLQHLEQVCKYVREPVASRRPRVPATRRKSTADEVLDIKANSEEIIDILVPKLLFLSVNSVPVTNDFQRSLAYLKMEHLVSQRTKSIPIKEEKASTFVLQDDIIIEDSSILTRADIKAKSRKIVMRNTVNEDLIPVFDTKRGRRKKKNF